MSLVQSILDDFALRNVGLGLAWVLGVLCLVPVQLASMIGFDATGLDSFVPDFVFMVIVPAAMLALIPTLVAWRLYTRRATYGTAVAAVTVFAVLAAYTTQFYGLCGPGC